MIDSLLGLVMLMLLTGWMAGVVSVQAMLSSPARSLVPREQVDLLAAVHASASAPADCKDLIKTAKSSATIAALQKLLLAPNLMVREDDQSVGEVIREQSSSGELPYGREQDLEKLLRVSSAQEANVFSFDARSSQDWFIQLSRDQRERLFLCN
jgi:hypothetical protein